jgi:hypothetical protein
LQRARGGAFELIRGQQSIFDSVGTGDGDTGAVAQLQQRALGAVRTVLR